jgi:hypothetical protein
MVKHLTRSQSKSKYCYRWRYSLWVSMVVVLFPKTATCVKVEGRQVTVATMMHLVSIKKRTMR